MKNNKDLEIDLDRIRQLSIDYKDAKNIAKEINESLDIYAFVVRKRARIIAIQHGDGSYLEFHSSCFRKIGKEFLAVFTEHHGFYVYHMDDIDSVKEWLSPKSLFYNKNL